MRILSIAPTRLSLFGGGTDVQPFCDIHGGMTLSMAINIRQKILLLSDEALMEGANNEFPFKADPYFYYKILDEFKINGGHSSRIINKFDGHIESGLGSSASAAVALVGAINKRLNLKMDVNQIAYKAWDLELNKLGLFGGKQDQYAAALGGVNVLQFVAGAVNPTPLSRGFIEKISECIFLFYTGDTRKDTKIQEKMKELTPEKEKSLLKIKQLCLDALNPIAQGDYKKVGKLLNEAWENKKVSNPLVSTKRIDDIYSTAMRSGAFGGKIMGSGGGGYMFFICDPEKSEKLIKSLEEIDCEWIDFCIDWNGLETYQLPFCPINL